MFSNVAWTANHATLVGGLQRRADDSVKQLGQTAVYVSAIQKSYELRAGAVSDVIEASFANDNGFNNNEMLDSAELILNSPSNSRDVQLHKAQAQAQAQTQGQTQGQEKLQKPRSLAANYELHLDHMSDVSFSQESLAKQIATKVLGPLNEFKTSYTAFAKTSAHELERADKEYAAKLKSAQSAQRNYANKSKVSEELNDASPVGVASPVASTVAAAGFSANGGTVQGSRASWNLAPQPSSLMQSISRAISRNNSDDDDDDDDDGGAHGDGIGGGGDGIGANGGVGAASGAGADSVAAETEPVSDDEELAQLTFPMQLGQSRFDSMAKLQKFMAKFYKDCENLLRNRNNTTQSVQVSSQEACEWLRVNRSKTENSIRNAEAFGQSLVTHGFLKMPVFRNLLSFNSKFVADKEIVYEFTHLAKYVVEFDEVEHAKNQELKLQRRVQEKLVSKELKHIRASSNVSVNVSRNASGFATPEKRSRANSGAVTPIQRVTSQASFKPLASTGVAAASAGVLSAFRNLGLTSDSPTKESAKKATQTAEKAYLDSVKELNLARKNFEHSFQQFAVQLESMEARKTGVILNSLNYLSFLLMKHSEFEHKKFATLNSAIAVSNNESGVLLELQKLYKNDSQYFYTPLSTIKFEKLDLATPSPALFATDVSLLPQTQDLSNLSIYSVPVFLYEFLKKLQELPAEDVSQAWVAPMDILAAHDTRRDVLDSFESQLESLETELNSMKQKLHLVAVEQCLKHVFETRGVAELISGFKLWLLELPDSLVPFVVFDKVREVYYELFDQVQEDLSADLSHDLPRRATVLVSVLQGVPRSNLASLLILCEHLSQFGSTTIAQMAQVDRKSPGAVPLAHLLMRPKSGKKHQSAQQQQQQHVLSPSVLRVTTTTGAASENRLNPTDGQVQFFLTNVVKDLTHKTVLAQLKQLLLDRETRAQKVSSFKEREGVRSVSAANSPALSRSNVNRFSSEIDTRRSSSNGTPSVTIEAMGTPTISTPTIMVEGLALRQFGTKRKDEDDSGDSASGDKLQVEKVRERRRSFSLLSNNSGIRIVSENAGTE